MQTESVDQISRCKPATTTRGQSFTTFEQQFCPKEGHRSLLEPSQAEAERQGTPSKVVSSSQRQTHK